MFLHLGGKTVIPIKEIIAILDVNSTVSKYTREFVMACQKGINVRTINKQELETKSIVITDKAVFFSPISPATLCKRIDFINNISISR